MILESGVISPIPIDREMPGGAGKMRIQSYSNHRGLPSLPVAKACVYMRVMVKLCESATESDDEDGDLEKDKDEDYEKELKRNEEEDEYRCPSTPILALPVVAQLFPFSVVGNNSAPRRESTLDTLIQPRCC